MLLRFALTIFAIVSCATAQNVHFQEEKLHGREAYVLSNAQMRVSALRGAGHIAEIRFLAGDQKKSINPMRVPHFQTIEPWEYDPAKHDKIYGGGTNRLLQSGYMGHLLNFPTFGAPSDDETKNGLGNHGEALGVEWRKDRVDVAEDAVRLWYSAHLPKTQYNVGRVLTLPADESVLYIEEWAQSLTDYDRPAHWVQHVTFGPPFVEPGKTILDMSGSKGEVLRDDSPANSLSRSPITWPEGKAYDGSPVSLRAMQTKANASTYYGVLMDQARERSFFTMYHSDYPVLIGYIWRTKDFPWIGDWQENGSNKPVPWNGRVQARGMEFGTTPFPGPLRGVVERGDVYGVPTYRWFGGRELATTRYVAFLAEIPSGYRGVADVRVANDKIIIEERETGKTIELKSARSW